MTLIYNTIEGAASIVVGAMAGSISLVGFGIDSVIEVSSSVAALWRFRATLTRRIARVEAITLRFIGLSFVALAAYVSSMLGVRCIYESRRNDRCRASSSPPLA